MKLVEHNKSSVGMAAGSQGHEGNETVDHLARMGFECPSIGPKQACSISEGVPKKAGTGSDEKRP
jgi:ribonuclease HI